MRVALIAPDWGNAWIPMIQDEVRRRGHTVVRMPHSSYDNINAVQVAIHGWATSKPVGSAKNIMFLRRYELFDGALSKQDWEHVSDLILCNTWIKSVVDKYFEVKGIKTRTHLIYNAVDTSAWTFRQRKPKPLIGMVCHVHPKKNLPLALEVLSHLPEHFELHIAGAIQDPCTAEYLNHLGKKLRRKVYLYGHIEREQLDLWWEQMGFCLSTSISEGNPNNVLEAMAKGIMPVVLNWPGAEDQFPEGYVQNSAERLANVIINSYERTDLYPYFSEKYREHVEAFHSLNNIKTVIDIALEE